MGQFLGYARVSTDLQDPALQLDALTAAGAARVWIDHASGSKTDRPELGAMLDYARAGDNVVVWRPDRLGRSLAHLVQLVEDLGRREIGFRSLTESAIDTTTPSGNLMFAIAGAFAQFERDLISQRTRAGLAAARARGRPGGRPNVMTSDKCAAVDQLLAAPGATKAGVAKALGVSRPTIDRYLQRSAAAS